MLSKEEYDNVLVAAEIAQHENPRWRWGQAVFNTMYDLYPEAANEIRGTQYDMYHIDGNVDKFKELIKKDE